MSVKILAFLVVLSLVPVFEIMANPSKQFVTFQRVDGYVIFELSPSTSENEYGPLDVGILVFREGVLGIIPRNTPSGRIQFPLFHNLISLATQSTSMIIDPIFSFVSQYVPFWNYQPSESQHHMDIDYTQFGQWDTYLNRGGLGQTWRITQDPYLASWWHPNHYIVYIVEEDLYFSAIYVFGKPTVVNSQPLSKELIEQFLEDLGYLTSNTGGDTWIPYTQASLIF